MSQLTRTTTPQITILNGHLNTTSLDVANHFGRNHRNVIQKIENLGCSQEFACANFSAQAKKVKIHNGSVRDTPFYDITRDGFTMLAMGFTGKKAMAFKEGYIMAFNKMETELLKKYQQPAIPSTLSPASQRTVQEAVSTLAHDNKAYAKYYGALKTHFRVGTYKDIPNDQLEEVLQVLQGVVIEPKAIESSAPALTNTRLLLSYDHQGNQTTTQVPNNACVMTMKEMLKHVNATNGEPLDTDDLADFAISTIQRMQQRSKYYETKAQ